MSMELVPADRISVDPKVETLSDKVEKLEELVPWLAKSYQGLQEELRTLLEHLDIPRYDYLRFKQTGALDLGREIRSLRTENKRLTNEMAVLTNEMAVLRKERSVEREAAEEEVVEKLDELIGILDELEPEFELS